MKHYLILLLPLLLFAQPAAACSTPYMNGLVVVGVSLTAEPGVFAIKFNENRQGTTPQYAFTEYYNTSSQEFVNETEVIDLNTGRMSYSNFSDYTFTSNKTYPYLHYNLTGPGVNISHTLEVGSQSYIYSYYLISEDLNRYYIMTSSNVYTFELSTNDMVGNHTKTFDFFVATDRFSMQQLPVNETYHLFSYSAPGSCIGEMFFNYHSSGIDQFAMVEVQDYSAFNNRVGIQLSASSWSQALGTTSNRYVFKILNFNSLQSQVRGYFDSQLPGLETYATQELSSTSTSSSYRPRVSYPDDTTTEDSSLTLLASIMAVAVLTTTYRRRNR